MELRRIDIVSPYRGGEGLPVGGPGGNNGFVHRLRKKAVHKINVTAARDAPEQRAIWIGEFDLVPTDLRNLQPRLFAESGA